MTSPAPASTPAANGARNGSSLVATLSVMPVVLKSVFFSTRPSPGKCLTVPITPPSIMPVRNAVDAFVTVAGSEPYWRPNLPIGSFPRPMSAGTVSVTGARLTLTPTALSSPAHVVAAAVSSAADIRACTLADGGAVKPSPRSWRTSPPSWSAASSSGMPAVAACVACSWRCRLVSRTRAAPSQPPR